RKLEWLLDREAEKRFDRGLDGWLKQTFREHASSVPEIQRDALEGIAWTMICQNPQALQSLKDGHMEVIDHYLEQAHAIIQKIYTDMRDFKPGKPVDRLLDALGPKSNDQAASKALGPRSPNRRAIPRTNDKRTLDQLIADLGNRTLTDDEAFGRRYASN